MSKLEQLQDLLNLFEDEKIEKKEFISQAGNLIADMREGEED